MIDMLTKIILFTLLATAAVCSPVGPSEEEDDLPVYTEKVVPGKPTQVPKFGAKKASTSPRKAHEKPTLEDRRPYEPSIHTTSVPKPILKSTKPLRSNARPVRRTNRIPIAPSVGYNEIKPSSDGDYEAPLPSFVAAKELGVEYATEVDAPSSHEDLIDDYKVRRIHRASAAPRSARSHANSVARSPRNYASAVPRRVHQESTDMGSAVGNAPQLRYAVPPQRFASAAAEVKDVPDYSYTGNSYEDKPQPYIFGYELQDESGSTQSRKEQGDDYGNKRGSYGYTDGHGIYRQVEYIADEHGFRAVVKTNEPGTDNQNPADVEMHSEAAKY